VRPLIPRVRVGDVLLGTRNLRHYLQTAATLNYLQEVSQDLSYRNRAKANLYRPSKEDEFLVTVNAWDTFGVYNVSKEVMLLFHNPSKDLSTPAGFIRKKPTGKSFPRRMDTTIFSKWFIRTNMKYTDLSGWPATPYYMWAALHMNLNSIRSDSVPNFHCDGSPHGPFHMGSQQRNWKRGQLMTLLRDWVPTGITRSGAPTPRQLPNQGFGPRLEDIEGMRRDIESLCSNPRLAQRLKSEDLNIYRTFLQNNQ